MEDNYAYVGNNTTFCFIPYRIIYYSAGVSFFLQMDLFAANAAHFVRAEGGSWRDRIPRLTIFPEVESERHHHAS